LLCVVSVVTSLTNWRSIFFFEELIWLPYYAACIAWCLVMRSAAICKRS